jgi:hypothetical protein
MATNPPDVLVKVFDIWMQAQRKALGMICAVRSARHRTGHWAEGFRGVAARLVRSLGEVIDATAQAPAHVLDQLDDVAIGIAAADD